MTPVVAVIVPTVLAFGLLFSLLVVIRDVWERVRGPGWMSRRCGHQGRAAAELAAGAAPEDVDRRTAGLRHRWTYVLTGALLLTVASWGLIGSWGNFVGWTDWLENIAWAFVALTAAASAIGVVGVASLRLAVGGRRPPAWVAALTARTPLGTVPARASVATTVVAHPSHARRAARRAAAPVRPLGRHHVTDAVAAWVRGLAGLWTLLAVAVIGWMTLSGRIPATPEELDTSIASPAWIVLYVLLVVASLAVYRWEVAGAIALAVVAALLALMSSLQYGPVLAVGLAAAFALPAFLHWLAWQRDRHVHHLARVAVFTVLMVGGVWFSAGRVYAHYFGPTHDDSVAVLAPEDLVEWAWAGATTSRSTTVVARTEETSSQVRLLVSDRPDLSSPRRSRPEAATTDGDRVVRLEVDGLAPDTSYWWAVEVDGQVDTGRTGRLRTLPEDPSSFTIAVSACARSGSNAAVFDTIRETDPLAYVVMGDLHYANIGRDDPGRFRDALDQVLTAPGQSALYRSTSIAYVWDDHDYAANDGDETSPSRPAAEQVYRAWVPYHPLASDEPLGPIGQSFVAGRVRVVVTDTRSQRSSPQVAEPDRQMLGPEQEAWFAAELAEARDAGQVVVWASSSPWIGEADPAQDTWAGYATARRRVADLIVAAGMQDRLVMVAGDAHMVALDDGSHTDYSTAQAGGFPLLQAAALDRPGSVKGGPYSGGTFPGGGQFGEVEVDDDGGPTIDVTLRGLTWRSEVLVEETVTLPAG